MKKEYEKPATELFNLTPVLTGGTETHTDSNEVGTGTEEGEEAD